MKKLLIIMAAVFTLGLAALPPKANAQVSASINFQFFYDNLSPYGTWVDYPDYGYVWRPAYDDGFHPYRSDGHWVWTDDYGWTWVSDYDWGWAPFHYGRWHHDPYDGWLWVPGYEWSPAWVTWRSSPDYYGWAPLGPDIGFSFMIGGYNPPPDYWVFVPSQYIASPVIYNYYASPAQNITYINKTKIINNYHFNAGPKKNVYVNGPTRIEAEKRTGSKIQSVKFKESNSPGRTTKGNNELAMFKPSVNDRDKRSAKPAKAIASQKGTKGNDITKMERSNYQSSEARTAKGKNNVVDAVRSQPKKQAVGSEKLKSQPQKMQTERKQPAVKEQPRKEQPVRTQPAKQPNRKEQPVRTQPTKQQTQKSQPAKTAPARQQQQKTQPVKQQQPRQQTAPHKHQSAPQQKQQVAPQQVGGGQGKGKKN